MGASRRVLLREAEFERLEFLISVQVALKVLEEDDLLVDRLWVVEEVELGDLISDTLGRLPVAVDSWLLLGALNVVEVEEVAVEDDLGAVVKEHTVGAVGEHVAETVLGREVHELGNELGAGLLFTLLDEEIVVDGKGHCCLDFGQLRLRLLLCASLLNSSFDHLDSSLHAVKGAVFELSVAGLGRVEAVLNLLDVRGAR